ncbi:ribonuclease HII [Corynebacterium sp. SCR221107]|uniref:ribonuclease HII n=1 Tax=Corynebacterium sp. SCR221107 TaxID=3017361 RepID=UPI0022EC19C5|nr:ribonuclease HII [Corynebacterium sp. SCR221107]WBT07928.1 ribonuclease HII [Corynebacterium sp. SCR221107]
MRTLKQLRTYEVALSKAGLGPVAGVDEAGRGACCGPITIAACILPDRPIKELERLTDSKKLSEKVRAELFPVIQAKALAWAIVDISAPQIDRFGIQHANISGMRRAVARLEVRPGYVLTDAMKVPGMATSMLPIIGGDAAARCIAAASVLAKHHRDQIMLALDEKYPGYGLAGHKGYGTKAHMTAVSLHGGCPEHRYSYANVGAAHRQWLASCLGTEAGEMSTG